MASPGLSSESRVPLRHSAFLAVALEVAVRFGPGTFRAAPAAPAGAAEMAYRRAPEKARIPGGDVSGFRLLSLYYFITLLR